MKTLQTLLLICALLIPSAISAQQIDKSKLAKGAQRSDSAAQVLTSALSLSGDTIPRELINRAWAVGVFPDVDRISILLPRTRLSYGVICSRSADSWSPPAYYGFGAKELDLTAKGTKKPDIIILFMNEKAVSNFQQGRVVLKDELVGFAGPIGELTGEKKNEIGAANVLIYTVVDGRVAGLRVDASRESGGVLNPDNNMNEGVYGLKGSAVLAGDTPKRAEAVSSVSGFQTLLTSLTKKQ